MKNAINVEVVSDSKNEKVENVSLLSRKRAFSKPRRSDDDSWSEELSSDSDNLSEMESEYPDFHVARDDWNDADFVNRINEALKDSQLRQQSVNENLWGSLYDYQKEGVEWLQNLYANGVGGILGDEMGLGKFTELSSLRLMTRWL